MKKKFLFSFFACIFLFLILFFVAFRHTAGYDFPTIQTDFFENKNVLIIVPHQDDELNLASGIIEQYTQGDNRITLVFCTNGDYAGSQELRYAEALNVAKQTGIDAENVYFLGFGDQWSPMEQDGKTIEHLYHSPAGDLLWTSAYGAQQTYGTSHKDCYLPLPYTRNAYVSAFVHLLQSIRPDTIYVNDFDEQPDHRAVSLLFEEAMGQVLRANTDYSPQVFKGFCYSTAWEGVNDLKDSLNLLSTKQMIPQNWEIRPYYHWDDRVRLPVAGSSRYVSQSNIYACLNFYKTQDAIQYIPYIANSDKVFWHRRTDSILYDAEILANGKSTEILNDFKLLDSSNVIIGLSDMGVADVRDGVQVLFPQPKTIECISLYDDPDFECNILAGYLVFEDNSTVPFGPLDPSGAATDIPFPSRTATGFTLYVTEYEGESPGLMELEAYEINSTHTSAETIIMLVDSEDNFVYDYVLAPDQQEAAFSLYSYPEILSLEDVSIVLTGDAGCSYEIRDGKLLLSFPSGSSQCSVTLTYEDTTITARFIKSSQPEYLFMRTSHMLDYRVCVNLWALLCSAVKE